MPILITGLNMQTHNHFGHGFLVWRPSVATGPRCSVPLLTARRLTARTVQRTPAGNGSRTRAVVRYSGDILPDGADRSHITVVP